MGGVSMSEKNEIWLPEVIVFAGPNGSVKTTITKMAKTSNVITRRITDCTNPSTICNRISF